MFPMQLQPGMIRQSIDAIGSVFVAKPETISATQIIPIDFCASLPPCPRLNAAADKKLKPSEMFINP